jgi:hypothetical protein
VDRQRVHQVQQFMHDISLGENFMGFGMNGFSFGFEETD